MKIMDWPNSRRQNQRRYCVYIKKPNPTYIDEKTKLRGEGMIGGEGGHNYLPHRTRLRAESAQKIESTRLRETLEKKKKKNDDASWKLITHVHAIEDEGQTLKHGRKGGGKIWHDGYGST
jgi:hypothetical protein